MKVNPDDYLEMIKRLERDISPIDAPAFYASAAISLKRIADALDLITAKIILDKAHKDFRS